MIRFFFNFWGKQIAGKSNFSNNRFFHSIVQPSKLLGHAKLVSRLFHCQMKLSGLSVSREPENYFKMVTKDHQNWMYFIGGKSLFLSWDLSAISFVLQDSARSFNKHNSVIFNHLYNISVTKYSNNLDLRSENTETIFSNLQEKFLQIRFINIWLTALSQNNGFHFVSQRQFFSFPVFSKEKKQKNPCALLVGKQTDAATRESSVSFPKNLKILHYPTTQQLCHWVFIQRIRKF